MSFANLPLLGVLAGIAGIAALLFLLQLLRIRHVEVAVPTTLFWRAAAREAPVRVLRGVFRHPLAYLLVLAICTLLWLAFAGPEAHDDRTSAYRVLFLDGSAHTAAGDDYQRAVDQAEGRSRRITRGTPGSDLGRRTQHQAVEGGRGSPAPRAPAGEPRAGCGAIGLERAIAAARIARGHPGVRGVRRIRPCPGGFHRARGPAGPHARQPRNQLSRKRIESGHRGARRQPGGIGKLGPRRPSDPDFRHPRRRGRGRCRRPPGRPVPRRRPPGMARRQSRDGTRSSGGRTHGRGPTSNRRRIGVRRWCTSDAADPTRNRGRLGG